MKIGVDARSLLVTAKEGMHVYASQLIRQWAASPGEHTFILYVDRPVPPSVAQDFLSRCQFIVLRPHWFWPQIRLTSHFVFHRKEIDVMFFPTQSMAFNSPAPTVAVMHDLAFVKFPDYFTAWNKFVLSKLTTNFTAKLATKLICVSQQTKTDVLNHYGVTEKSIEVIYHGFDTTTFYPRSQTSVIFFRLTTQLPKSVRRTWTRKIFDCGLGWIVEAPLGVADY